MFIQIRLDSGISTNRVGGKEALAIAKRGSKNAHRCLIEAQE